jgi:hypothetical protein
VVLYRGASSTLPEKKSAHREMIATTRNAPEQENFRSNSRLHFGTSSSHGRVKPATQKETAIVQFSKIANDRLEGSLVDEP